MNESLEITGHGFTIEDSLGFENVVKVLADSIRAHNEALTVGIYGEWGSGKTSFMRMLEKNLKVNNSSQQIKSVWFNPWRYQNEKDPSIALLNTIYGEIHEFGDKWADIATTLFDFIAVISEGTDVEMGPITVSGKELHQSSRRRDEERNTNQLGGKVSTYYRVHNKLETGFKGLLNGQKLITFIDDMDRCLPKNALRILSGIQTLFDVPNCIFVVAADPLAIRKAIQTEYPYVESADHYLQKFIHLAVDVPHISLEGEAVHLFMKTTLPFSDWYETDFLRPKEKFRTLADIFLRGVRPNPRHMWQVAYRYKFMQNLVQKEPRLNAIINSALLLKIALLQIALGDEFSKVVNDPMLLVAWENNERLHEISEDRQTEIINILGGRKSSEEDIFSNLRRVDLRVHVFIAEDETSCALSAVKQTFRDVTLHINDVEPLLINEDFQAILDKFRRYLVLRSDDPDGLDYLFAALHELSAAEATNEQVEQFFDKILDASFLDIEKAHVPLMWRASLLKGPLSSDTSISSLEPFLDSCAEKIASRVDPDDTFHELFDDAFEIDSHKISLFPVTNVQYERFDLGHEGRRFEPRDGNQHPVVLANAYEATLFCKWLNKSKTAKSSNWKAILPTLSNVNSINIEMVVNKCQCPDQDCRRSQDRKIHGLVRNVWEWTQTRVGGGIGLDLGQSALWLWSGSWRQPPSNVEEALKQRLWLKPIDVTPHAGFRVWWNNEHEETR